MKHSTLVALLIIVTFFGVGGFLAYRTFTTTGPQAVATMDADERALFERFAAIERGMTIDEVTALLGEPDENTFGHRLRWQANGHTYSVIQADFREGVLTSGAWIKAGRFFYPITRHREAVPAGEAFPAQTAP